MIDLQNIIAIDVHTHAEVSCRQPHDDFRPEFDEAFARYFKSAHRPTIQETAEYCRERKIAFVMFCIDADFDLGRRRIPNEEIAEIAAQNADVMIPFASIDPHKGRMGAREARRLMEEFGVKGFKFHPTVQGFQPNDRMAYHLYEVIAGAGLPMLFHSGHSGFVPACGVGEAWARILKLHAPRRCGN